MARRDLGAPTHEDDGDGDATRADAAGLDAARRELAALALRYPELRAPSARARLATSLDADDEADHGGRHGDDEA